MRQALVALVVALSIFGAVEAIPDAATVPVVQQIAAQDAEAGCGFGVWIPAWYINGYHGKETASGCGTVTLQVCLINTAGMVYGCNTFTGSGASLAVYSAVASTWYGCTQATYAWHSGSSNWYRSGWGAVC